MRLSEILYKYDGKSFYNFSLQILYQYKDGFITDFYGRFLYKIDGSLSKLEMAFLITLLKEGLVNEWG